MFDDLEDTRADRALRAGLRDLLTSEPSADFEMRILTALERRPPWWRTAWSAARPAISPAICALVVMLLLLHLAQQAPIGALPPRATVIARAAAPKSLQTQAVGDSSLESMDNIDLTSASLSFLSHPTRRIPGKRG